VRLLDALVSNMTKRWCRRAGCVAGQACWRSAGLPGSTSGSDPDGRHPECFLGGGFDL